MADLKDENNIVPNNEVIFQGSDCIQEHSFINKTLTRLENYPHFQR